MLRCLIILTYLTVFFFYSAFQIDELHRHNQNLVGTLHARSLLWSTDMKTAVSSAQPYLNSLKNWQFF